MVQSDCQSAFKRLAPLFSSQFSAPMTVKASHIKIECKTENKNAYSQRVNIKSRSWTTATSHEAGSGYEIKAIKPFHKSYQRGKCSYKNKNYSFPMQSLH